MLLLLLVVSLLLLLLRLPPGGSFAEPVKLAVVNVGYSGPKPKIAGLASCASRTGVGEVVGVSEGCVHGTSDNGNTPYAWQTE